MQIIAEAEDFTGFTRSLPVRKLDDRTRKLAMDRFDEYRHKGVILNDSYEDDVWMITDEIRKCSIDFHMDSILFEKNAKDWIGCTGSCFRECVRAYAALMLGGFSILSIQRVVKNLSEMAGITAEDAVNGAGADLISHRADFLMMIPGGNDIRDDAIEDMEDPVRHRKNVGTRELPDIGIYLSFGRKLGEFWKVADRRKRVFYFPVYLWWNLTSILPLRVTEFLMTPWECIEKTDKGYTITVRRTKMKKKRSTHGYRIDEDYGLCTYSITENMYSDIEWYRQNADTGNRSGKGTLLVPEGEMLSGYFTYQQMRSRLNKICRDELTVNPGDINLGDTRHLAMINLILSGGSPVICKELAGHEDIEASAHYYSNMSCVVESLVADRFRGWKEKTAVSGKNRYYISLPDKRIKVKSGWCDYLALETGDVSECLKAYIPGGEIGDCTGCRHFYAERKGLQIEIEKAAKKTVDQDAAYLLEMIEIVRKSLGYEEDIDEAVSRIHDSASRYAGLIARRYKEEE